MKEFDLKAALNGEPVMLRNGQKAIIYYRTAPELKLDKNTPDPFPLKGMVFDKDGYLDDPSVTWRCNGRFRYSEDEWDIIGMWEEPKKQISIEDLPKPFKPKTGDEYKYIVGVEVFRRISVGDSFDKSLSMGGQCYRTEEDAQKWLDFMKSMME
mgnify:CR=1 FL=1